MILSLVITKEVNKYWQLEKERGKLASGYEFFNDYVNQTYWLTCKLNKILDFEFFKNFNLAFGTGLDDSQFLNNSSIDGGLREYYISLDYNLKHILENQIINLSKMWFIIWIILNYQVQQLDLHQITNFIFFTFSYV